MTVWIGLITIAVWASALSLGFYVLKVVRYDLKTKELEEWWAKECEILRHNYKLAATEVETWKARTKKVQDDLATIIAGIKK